MNDSRLLWQDACLTLPGLYVCSRMGIPPPQPAAQATAAVDASALTAALQATMRAGPAAPAGPALEDVLMPDALLPLLQSPDMLSRLAPHMPEEQRCAVCIRPFLMLASSESSRHRPVRSTPNTGSAGDPDVTLDADLAGHLSSSLAYSEAPSFGVSCMHFTAHSPAGSWI